MKWRASIQAANAPSGTLTKKIQRQVRKSENTPPSVGPTTADIAQTLATYPWTLARSASDVEVADDRHAGRLDRAGAEALQPAEDDQRGHVPGEPAQDRADTNSAMPTSMIGLRPWMSENLAKIGVETAAVSR